MSVWVWAYANHNINFSSYANNDEELVDEILDKLNGTNLSDNEKVCKLIDCKSEDNWVCSWVEKERSYWPKTITLNLGSNLEIEVSKHFIFLDANTFNYCRWFSPNSEAQASEIELWRFVFKSIVKALGGDTIEYYPDNMLEPYQLMPSEMDNYESLDFDTHLKIIKEKWDNIYYSYDEAVRDWPTMENCPLLIEKLN